MSCVPPDLIHWEEHSTSVLTKPESNHKQSDKPNLERFAKIIGQYSAKVLDRERKERGKEGKGRRKKQKDESMTVFIPKGLGEYDN